MILRPTYCLPFRSIRRMRVMSIRLEYLTEPKLQFGQYFEHEDSKTGLAEFGPFGLNVAGLHCSEIKLAFVGTRETIDVAKRWVEECGLPIESENVKRNRQTGSRAPGLLDEE